MNKPTHPNDWFPTLSFFPPPFTKSIGLHGRNMRPNSEISSGSRGDFKLPQLDQAVVEKRITEVHQRNRQLVIHRNGECTLKEVRWHRRVREIGRQGGVSRGTAAKWCRSFLQVRSCL